MDCAMTYVVTDACINCKYQDCIDRCVCEPKCPVDAIKPNIIPNADKWIALKNGQILTSRVRLCQMLINGPTNLINWRLSLKP
jgi:hypothetical protein